MTRDEGTAGGAGSDLAGAAARLAAEVPAGARPVVVVLGSGLGAAAGSLEEPRVVPYRTLPGMPACGVPGHGGRVVVGRAAGRSALVFEGRCHLYEGVAIDAVTFAVRLGAALASRGVLLTTAVGGLSPGLAPGTVVRVTDQINLTGEDPARVRPGSGPPGFSDLRRLYPARLAAALDALARERGLDLAPAVLAGVRGPSYETPAEARALNRLGADVVCMSTVLEAMAAAQRGLPVLALGVVTNAAGAAAGTSHDGVLATAAAVAGRLAPLVADAVGRLDWDAVA